MNRQIKYYETRCFNGTTHCRTNPQSRFWLIMLTEEQAEKEYKRMFPTKYSLLAADEALPTDFNKLLCHEFEQNMLNERTLDEAVPLREENSKTHRPTY